MSEPIQTTHVIDSDLLEGAATCNDVTCVCELAYGQPATDDDEARILWWMWGPCERGQT